MRLYDHCRLCKGKNLKQILDLGNQPMSGIFPKLTELPPPSSPLVLMYCDDCGFVQLKHSANVSNMYGLTYGYHSSLSQSMVAHLKAIVKKLSRSVNLTEGDSVLDIGCNDGTLLNSYSEERRGISRFGIDPSSEKFLSHFEKDIKIAIDFFSAYSARSLFADQKQKIVTSIAMFYDLDDPVTFARTIRDILHDEGIWALELSYFPTLMSQLTYDQICHEHVGYYGLRDLKRVFDVANLKILDVEFNDMNGGSIFVIVSKNESRFKENTELVERILKFEESTITLKNIRKLEVRIKDHRNDLNRLLMLLKQANKSVYGYGASTKGNVVLNFCGIGPEEIGAIGDLNTEKHGRQTPGSKIPIISHEEIEALSPDYLIVFVWHFRSEIIKLKLDFLKRGGVLVFVLPRIHFVSKDNYEYYLRSDFSDHAFTHGDNSMTYTDR